MINMNYSDREMDDIFAEMDTAKSVYGVFEVLQKYWWGGKKAVEKHQTDDGIELRFHTYGWSDNEELISHMQNIENFGAWRAWILTWQIIRRGGHYTFLLPKQDVIFSS